MVAKPDKMTSTFYTFASQLTLQEACELGVSVRNKSIFLAFIPEGTDYITQRQKATIDADACGGNQTAQLKLYLVQTINTDLKRKALFHRELYNRGTVGNMKTNVHTHARARAHPHTDRGRSTLTLPSFRRSPSAFVFFCLSEPARSTR